jgi:hypothetical protein
MPADIVSQCFQRPRVAEAGNHAPGRIVCALSFFALAMAVPAEASNANVTQKGGLNVLIGVQTNPVNSLNVTQSGGKNITAIQQYGGVNTSKSSQNGGQNANMTVQAGSGNFSDLGQSGGANRALVIQSGGNGTVPAAGSAASSSAAQIVQDGAGPANLVRTQFVDHGVVTFATIYHTGGVNIVTLTSNPQSFGIMGRAH